MAFFVYGFVYELWVPLDWGHSPMKQEAGFDPGLCLPDMHSYNFAFVEGGLYYGFTVSDSSFRFATTPIGGTTAKALIFL